MQKLIFKSAKKVIVALSIRFTTIYPVISKRNFTVYVNLSLRKTAVQKCAQNHGAQGGGQSCGAGA